MQKQSTIKVIYMSYFPTYRVIRAEHGVTWRHKDETGRKEQETEPNSRDFRKHALVVPFVHPRQVSVRVHVVQHKRGNIFILDQKCELQM